MLKNLIHHSLIIRTQHVKPCMLPVPKRNFWGGGRNQNDPEFDISKDLYKILDLPKDATSADIKNQYYKLCYQYHPDRTGGVQQDRFKEITSAYSVLGNTESKRKYDEAVKEAEGHKTY